MLSGSSSGASYSSLDGEVYRTTTVPTQSNSLSAMELLKKYVSRNKQNITLDHVEEDEEEERFIQHQIAARTMPSDNMDDIQLKNIQLQFPVSRSLSKEDSMCEEERVETQQGSLLVAVQGDRTKPAIFTYHDIGLNYVANFQAFFNFVDMRNLMQQFCIYHVNAPGQEEGAAILPEGYQYPTMDELADQLNDVMVHFGRKRFIGFGCGFGANVLCRFALANPEKVDALCVVNCISTQSGWIEWGYQKLNIHQLRTKGMTQGALEYLLWHHFGKLTDEWNPFDLVQVYRQYFEKTVNCANLSLLIQSYITRSDLGITRELDPVKKKDAKTLRMPVLNIVGAYSPHVDDTVTLNGRCDPANSTWMKIQDCGMVIEEQPGKVSEAFRLFLQGLGYGCRTRSVKSAVQARKMSAPVGEVPTLSRTRLLQYRKASMDAVSIGNNTNGNSNSHSNIRISNTSNINITENPISETEAAVC